MTEVRVPTLGESVTEATVATWFKQAGDTVAQDEMLAPKASSEKTAAASKPAAGGSAAETLQIAVPTLGESVTEATVAAWFKNAGDAVATDEIICELETDKVSVEVPAPAAGVIVSIDAAMLSRLRLRARQRLKRRAQAQNLSKMRPRRKRSWPRKISTPPA